MKEIISIDSGRTLLKLRRRLIKSFMDLLILSKLREEPMSRAPEGGEREDQG